METISVLVCISCMFVAKVAAFNTVTDFRTWICMCLLQELKERVLKGKYRIPYYMSTDCESLVNKFLVVIPTKRTSLEVYIIYF